MLTNLIDQLAGEMLLHVAFLTAAVAFLVRDVLWLRGLSIIAYSLFMAVAAMARPEAPWSLIGWYSGFICINLGHAGWLICERWMCGLTHAERKLLEIAFPAIDQLTLKRLLRQGGWRDLAPGTRLTQRGSRPDNLYVIYEGHVDVYRDGQLVAAIGPGHFVGEIAFVTGNPASADTYAATAVKTVVWDQETIGRISQRQLHLREALYSAIGPDLSRKIVNMPTLESPYKAQNTGESGAANQGLDQKEARKADRREEASLNELPALHRD
jgi:CRP-like cAMP-binding protein